MRDMRDSGVAWIGEIPSDWSLVRFKDKYVNVKEIAKERSAEFERLALTLNGVIKRPKDDSEGLQPKEFDGYQILRENDFIFKMIDLQNISTSRVGLSPYTGLVSPAYIRFSPKKENQYNQFVYYYLMSLYYNCVYNNLGGNGVRSALNAADMGEFLMPYPEESEQRKICAFLDKKRSQVDTLIANVHAQIEKLKAYKQSLISEVVTKGLDHTEPMKDSGIGWIGEIPKSWEVKPMLREIETIVDYRGKTPEKVAEGTLLVTARNIKDGRIDYSISREYVKPEEYDEIMHRGKLNIGDVLFTTEAPLGAVANVDRTDFALAQRIIKFTTKKSLNPYYLKYWMLSPIFQQHLKSYATGSTASGIKASKLCLLQLVHPPRAVQDDIVSTLDSKCDQVDRLIAIKQAKIERMEQYKRSLIYEYVTGKREVV